MAQQLLVEYFNPNEAQLTESRDQHKNLFLSGRMMAGDQKNLNGREYPKSQLENAVKYINQKIKEGSPIPGELNHPSDLGINLANVSHVITEAWMDGSNGFGRCKVLRTPSGLIVESLIEGGVKIGWSTRGSGNVTHEGIVEDFTFITTDIVANPSGPGCYPDIVREAKENKKILTLSEAVLHDDKAQKYFKAEIKKFIESLTSKK